MVSAAQFNEALERIGARECPFCKASSWGIAESDFALQPLEATGVVEDKAMAVRPLVCEGCGFVRLIHVPSLFE
jgi:predicted Zn-ribbon and HTH transcriptional regulator